MKILVADDSKTNLAMLVAALNKLNHEVIPATSGYQAIELFQQSRPDLIILDVVMDGIDGFETARIIREIDSQNWIPIIFLSASLDDTYIARGIDAGGDDYLTKPCSEVTLAAKIKAMQRISDMRQELFEATQKLFLLSSTDPLTGVYNRLQFDRTIKEILTGAERFGYMVALLFIDLDNFKNINDSFGHHIGDILLIEVAKRLKSCIRSNDFLARLGGDEFAIILSGVESTNDAEVITQKIIDTISLDYLLEEHNIRNGASIGLAFYPDGNTNKESLILNADVAMYHAKASGRNNYQVFSEELEERYRNQINIEHSLKFAIERKELYLTYQPIYDLQTGYMGGLEVLLCWDHPKFGLLSPSLFIPLAEETGLITRIGSWVLSTACQQAKKWPINKIKNFRFAINISSRQLTNEDFYERFVDLLAESNLSPELIEMELTETTLMTYNNHLFNETINRLHDIGIKIAIDDFGTGYSSLFRLKHLPIDTLKIEKSFVQDAVVNQNSAIIVSCLIALGKNLGMNVVAEGIETKQQLEFLLDHECPQGQGFYLSKPLESKSVELLLDSEIEKYLKLKT